MQIHHRKINSTFDKIKFLFSLSFCVFSGTNSNSQNETLPDVMKIPYSEVCKATDNFDKVRILGKGGFGIVYRGELSFTPVAIKRLSPVSVDFRLFLHFISKVKTKKFLNNFTILVKL